MISMHPKQISVVGLGYVGLPLAVGLSKYFNVVGYDIDDSRIKELKEQRDRTGEVTSKDLASTKINFTNSSASLSGTDLFIIAVPTPVDAKKKPDLGALKSACVDVGKYINIGTVVVFESTVYPGATEEFCGPILENISGSTCGRDFFLGYSPERMNPGDPEHTLSNLVKVVSGQTPEVEELLTKVYGKITNIFVAKNIITAESAKVIENAQRDINIAFINEVTQIFNKLNVSIYDVLDAANTKWNFLNFRPGLVGGHCIGVDPYYLAERAQQVGFDPVVLLSGRRTNDSMADWIASSIDSRLSNNSNILVLGLTFKENVPDLRNSGAAALVRGLEKFNHTVFVHDPYANPDEALKEYQIDLLSDKKGQYDCVVGAVSHKEYKNISEVDIVNSMPDGGLLVDIKGMWRDIKFPSEITVWRL